MTEPILDPRRIEGDWLVVFDGEFKQTEDGVWYTTDIEGEVAETDLIVVKEYKGPGFLHKQNFENIKRI